MSDVGAPGLDAITAVILNWRTPHQSERAGRALLGDGLPAERLVLVDNGSGDASAERLRAAFPDSPLVALGENVGFARGNNAGARALPGAAYLFVNSDAFLHRPESLLAMAGAFADPGVGIVVPRILNEDLTLQGTVSPLRRPGAALARASGLSRLIPNELQPRWSIFWDHGRSREVEYAAAPVVMVRSRAWDALGGFDESIHMYAEDVDLCWRARTLGERTWFCAEAEFVHLGNASGAARWDEPARWERMARAEATVVRRHLPARSARLTLGITNLGLAARVAYHRLAGNRDAERILRAWMRGYRGGA